MGPSWVSVLKQEGFFLSSRDLDDSGSGCSTPSSHLLPPLTGHGGRLSPSIVIAEQGSSRRNAQFYFDNSSSESLDSDHRSPNNSRPSSAPKDIQRTPLPTGSSIFQKLWLRLVTVLTGIQIVQTRKVQQTDPGVKPTSTLIEQRNLQGAQTILL